MVCLNVCGFCMRSAKGSCALAAKAVTNEQTAARSLVCMGGVVSGLRRSGKRQLRLESGTNYRRHLTREIGGFPSESLPQVEHLREAFQYGILRSVERDDQIRF